MSITLAQLAAAKRLPIEFLRGLGLTDAPRRRVRIPYRDEDGADVEVRFRHNLDIEPRFTWRTGGHPQPYGLDRLADARVAGWVLLVEGESDCWTAWLAGIPALGIPGKTTWRPEWAEDVAGLDVVLWQEPDAEDLVARVRQDLPDVKVIVAPAGTKDISEAHVRGDDVVDLVERLRAGAPPAAAPGPASPAPTLAEALANVETFLRRFVVLARPEALVAVVLWIAHTWAIKYADATPYLAISSPAKQSGKTRLLECLGLLARTFASILITPTAATIFRSLDASDEAALLLDELDAVFRDRSDKYEEVRAVINGGHRRGATVPRMVPGPKNTWVVKPFPVFGPKALAGIGKLPDTVADRAIPIRMVKRKRSEPVERFHQRTASGEAAAIVAGLTAALAAQPPALEADLPPELSDRAADAWEPLLAIADAAGAGWPARARTAAVVLHASRDADDSLGLRLLADIRLVFAGRGVDRIFTEDLIRALQADEEGPWRDEREPLSPHRLATLLCPFEITPKQLRIGLHNKKGYLRDAFLDVWERYLPEPPSPAEPQHRNTEQPRGFDVSDSAPTDVDGPHRDRDLPIEDAYPRSAWDPDYEDPPADWAAMDPIAQPNAR